MAVQAGNICGRYFNLKRTILNILLNVAFNLSAVSSRIFLSFQDLQPGATNYTINLVCDLRIVFFFSYELTSAPFVAFKTRIAIRLNYARD